MDVVADARAIGCVPVTAKYAELRTPANSHLCDEGQKVVWDALRVLANAPRLVGPDRVEVSQDEDVPRLHQQPAGGNGRREGGG